MTPEAFRGTFDNGNNPDLARTSSLQGTTYFDPITGQRWPWYEFQPTAIFNGNGDGVTDDEDDPDGIGNEPDGTVIAVEGGKMKVIGSADAPYMAVPYTYDLNVEDKYLHRLELLWRFRTWVSVRTLDQRNDAHMHYANQALASWSWNASGNVVIGPVNQNVRPMSYTRDNQQWVTPPGAWQPTTGGQGLLSDPIFNTKVENDVSHWYGN